jgi:magnesium transporter
MPPTLLGAIWGMNFEYMPELDDRYAYALALLLMLLSATIPLWIVRRMGWLSR